MNRQMWNGGIVNDATAKKFAFLAVAAVSVLVSFWALSFSPVGNHEAYVAATARGMLNSGDWVVPVFNGEVRINKTPLCYWMVAAAAKAAGGINDFVVRLPTAVLAVVSALAIFYFVSEWLGVSIAVLSSLIWSTSLCFIRYSHTARPEMALSVFVAISMLSFYSAVIAQSRRRQVLYALVFWLSFSLSMLAKGPAPLPVMFPALFFYFAIFRKWKFIPKLLPAAGVILFLLIFLPWPIAILAKCPQAVEIWKNEFLGRAAGEYAAGSKPFYYYFKIMFVYMAPFSAFIPLALGAPFYSVWEKKRRPMFYLWLWFVGGVIAMSLCGGKRQHYILPMMPAMAILVGIILDDMIFLRKAYSRKFSSIFLAVHLFIFSAGTVGAIVWLLRSGVAARYLITCSITAALAFFIAAAVLFASSRKVLAIVCFFAAACVLIMFWPCFESMQENENFVIKDFARNVSICADGREVVAYCKVNPSFVYYFDRDVRVVSDVDLVCSQYPSGIGIIATGENFEQLKNDSRFLLSVEGIDNGRGFFVKIK
ncbi:MAG: glycosyltransferase family 39 protein [Phycisphaerae bacterium]|nr:glycosyltransferase family 39 protein [Phycisphaerae bacterium]